MDETLKRQAYLEGAKLKSQGFDREVILARLDKLGVSYYDAEVIVNNLFIQSIIEADKTIQPTYNTALLKIGLGILLAIISLIVFPGIIFMPVGLIVSGTLWYLITRKKYGAINKTASYIKSSSKETTD